MKIVDLLGEGPEQAVTREALIARTGLTDSQLRKQIHRERLDGALILSSGEPGGGYFLPVPGDVVQLQKFIVSMEARAGSCLEVLGPAREALAEIKGCAPQDRE